MRQARTKQDKATIVEVAALAGISVSAVSRAFNPGASCSAVMRAKAMQAAEQLGYKPNRLARGMKSRSNLIGILVTDFDNPAYLSILSDFTSTLQRQGYHTLLLNVGEDTDIKEAVELVMEYQVDGLIVTSSSLPQGLVEVCHAQHTPVVIFARHSRNNPVSVVCCDNVSAGQKAADTLVAGGYQRFAFVGGVEGVSTTLDRQRGFIGRLVELGHEHWQIAAGGRHSYDAGFDAACRLFAQSEPPDAIFFVDDIMACGGMDAIRHEFGLQIPQDVGVVGMDDIRFAHSLAYNLTTIKQPFAAMAQKTVDVLLSQINHPDQAVQQVILPCELIARTSVRHLV